MILTIAVILQGIAICVLAGMVIKREKDIKHIEEGVNEIIYNRNHISRQEQGVIEGVGRNNRDLIEKLAKEMDKKVEPVYSNYYTGHPSDASFYVLVDLTEKEKRANELRREIEKLEESDD